MGKEFFITGGGGFIGSNLVYRLLQKGENVIVYDNLSRAGAPKNISWLKDMFGESAFKLVVGDVRDMRLLEKSAIKSDVIIHLAGQVAVTSSVRNPRDDFESNALGTFNVLEVARQSERNPILIYSSTNKVYGGMEEVEVVEGPTRWLYKNLHNGCPEEYPLDFHSPYGCSKGAGDQYVRDYHRIYGLRTVVFRQSCIYGPRQFGIEDQGWLAWLIIAAITNRPITIFGDGKQVRDILYVDDLVDAYMTAIKNINIISGEIFNIGGGPENIISVWKEFGPIVEDLLGKRIPVVYDDWRPGDQRVFFADIQKAKTKLGWKPKIKKLEGIEKLFRWVQENKHMF